MSDTAAMAAQAATQVTTPAAEAVPHGTPQEASAPNTEGMTKEEAKEEIRKHKVRYDGKDYEVDEAELKRGWSHQKAANKAMQEGLAMRKQAENFINQLRDKKSIFKVIEQLGYDPRQLSEEFLGSKIEEELMDPKDRKLKELEMKLREKEEWENEQKEAVKKKHIEELKNKYSGDYTKQFTEALEQTEVPKTKETVASMAKYIYEASKMGYQMSAVDAAKMVQEDISKSIRAIIGNAEGERLIKLLGGEEVANKIRKFDTSRVKNPEQNLQTPTQQTKSERVRERKGPMTPTEWRQFNRT